MDVAVVAKAEAAMDFAVEVEAEASKELRRQQVTNIHKVTPQK